MGGRIFFFFSCVCVLSLRAFRLHRLSHTFPFKRDEIKIVRRAGVFCMNAACGSSELERLGQPGTNEAHVGTADGLRRQELRQVNRELLYAL